MLTTRPIAATLFAAVACAGCQSARWSDNVSAGGSTQAVIRGQSEEPSPNDGVRLAQHVAPWGASYLAPGEVSCDTPPPPLGLGYETLGDPAAFAPPGGYFVPPSALAAPSTLNDPGPPKAGWFDVLPPDGGPISDDFGLPQGASVGDRVPNPLYVATSNPDAAWETIARSVSRYFPIRREQRVRVTGTIASEGVLETQWTVGSTIFEPWRRDSAGGFNRWQSTLQTVRRRAVVRVLPAASGYELEVRVDKQLEDLNRPERATAGAASLDINSALPSDRVTPIDPVRDSGRWIDIGRDEATEQRLLADLGRRFGAMRR
ncbi:MAG: hypothetical protein AAF805_09080 [Planctomycetota bacterium]